MQIHVAPSGEAGDVRPYLSAKCKLAVQRGSNQLSCQLTIWPWRGNGSCGNASDWCVVRAEEVSLLRRGAGRLQTDGLGGIDTGGDLVAPLVAPLMHCTLPAL